MRNTSSVIKNAKLLFAIILIAIQAIITQATGQNQSLSVATTGTSVVTTERVRAELMAHAPQGVAVSGDKIDANTVWVGLQLAHQPHWHTYWKNSGDSGAPTTLEWILPVGVMAGDIAWPTPQKIRISTLANYGYEGTVLLAVPLIITPDFKPAGLNKELNVKLKAQWLACKQECVPEEGEFALTIPVQSSTAINAAVFNAVKSKWPQPLNQAVSKVDVQAKSLLLTVTGLPAALQGKTLEAFPEVSELIETAATPTQSWLGNVWTANIPLSALRANSPASVPWVLKVGDQSWYTVASVTGGAASWPKVESTAVSPALTAALESNKSTASDVASNSAAGSDVGMWASLVGAFLGGLILNLMPCVFPVLAIKVVSFSQHSSHSEVRLHRQSGIAYLVGVVLSFVLLGGLMLALRAAGEQLGWGFQLQSPAVVAALAVLFTIIGLNLAGLFEFGSVLPSNIASARAKHPMVDSFLSGILAVAVASPCTAPFMGASLGFALGLPAVQALMIFAAIGVGMALPFVLASFIPAVARALPRPGAWMDTFKKLMAFPMFATVVWLVWVLGQQSGIDGAGALLLILLATAMLLWTFTLQGRTRIWLGLFSLLALVYSIVSFGPQITKLAEPVATSSNSTNTTERWQAWAPNRVEQLLAEGKPVFVDFTAAWCVTCQYNKKTTLANAELLANFDAKKINMLRADWTRRDPAITAALAKLGRNGVPVYVFYAPGKAPVVLSEVISVDDVNKALAGL
jgi:thiol:disulfide interchange protein/DsbC/DsbD-like thiol-disulfide interchange protein